MKTETKLTRRGFLGSAAAFMAVRGFGSVETLLGGRPELSFGVLSDIHIGSRDSTGTFRKALRYYRDRGVDAVMICGDLANYGLLSQLKEVANAWYDVFPGDRGADGRHVEKVFIYGNHDADGLGFYGNPGTAQFLMHSPGRTPRELQAEGIAGYGHARAWEECFHEQYSPVYMKNVKGYWFIGGHWDTQAGVRGLGDFLREHGDKLRGEKPFFYCQHQHPRGTVYRYGFFTHDDGTTTRLLSRFPNAVAFSGHSHTTLTDERSVWRGEFTSIGCSTLTAHGANVSRTYENLMPGRNYHGRPSRQGMLVSVSGARMVIERRDFFFDETLDEAWVLELPKQADWSFKTRAERSERPEFAAGAFVEVFYPEKVGADGTLRFPAALANSKARPFDYGVTIEYRYDDDDVSLHRYRMAGPTAHLPKAHDADVPLVQCVLPGKYMPLYDTGEYRITVEAHNSLGAAGKPLTTGWVRIPKE